MGPQRPVGRAGWGAHEHSLCSCTRLRGLGGVPGAAGNTPQILLLLPPGVVQAPVMPKVPPARELPFSTANTVGLPANSASQKPLKIKEVSTRKGPGGVFLLPQLIHLPSWFPQRGRDQGSFSWSSPSTGLGTQYVLSKISAE